MARAVHVTRFAWCFSRHVTTARVGVLINYQGDLLVYLAAVTSSLFPNPLTNVQAVLLCRQTTNVEFRSNQQNSSWCLVDCANVVVIIYLAIAW